MPVKYCTQCGSKHEYTLKPAIFCGSCGEVLDAKAAAQVKERKTIVVDSEEEQSKPLSAMEKLKQRRLAKVQNNQEEDIDEGEDEDDNTPLPKIGALDISIVKPKTESIADIAIGAAPEPRVPREAGPLVFKNQKQFKRDFSKLAGSSRK